MERNGAAIMMRVLGGIIGAYSLFTAWGFATIMMYRAGITPPIQPDPQTMGSFVPVLIMLPGPVMLLWGGAAVLYAITAWRMLTGRRGAEWYTTALLVDLSFLLYIKNAGAVKADPNAVDLDYVTAAITITLAGVIWLVQRAAFRPAVQSGPALGESVRTP